MRLRATAVVVAAQASAQRLRASVTVANPVVQAQVVVAAAATTAEIHAASVTYEIPVAAISHINLVVGVILDDSGRFRFITDTAVVLESLSYSMAKLLADTAVIQERRSVSFSKLFSDTWSATDTVYLQPELSRADSISTTDDTTYTLAKGLNDAPVIVETLYFSVEKLLADGVGMNDSFDLNDGSTYSFAKAINNVSFVTDAMAKDLQRGVLEAVTIGSTGVLSVQNYCDITYFAEDYVGDSRTFT